MYLTSLKHLAIMKFIKIFIRFLLELLPVLSGPFHMCLKDSLLLIVERSQMQSLIVKIVMNQKSRNDKSNEHLGKSSVWF